MISSESHNCVQKRLESNGYFKESCSQKLSLVEFESPMVGSELVPRILQIISHVLR